ncbi:MAG: hypothetical protein DRI56_08065 [Chloroflexota bacterium]|nr:MAG: hypothetical protein DRI56_08065 [Chloroflexota bacterium]
MQTRKINFKNKKDVRKFIQLPFDLYQNNAYWVPPLRSDIKAILDKEKHPFYQHSEADFFLVEENSKVLGRIAVVNNHRYNKNSNTQKAFFYFFETVNNAEVSNALFEAAFGWARQHGLKEIKGPRGLLQGDGAGLLVEGFNHSPAMGIAYNLPYYHDLITQAGFEKLVDYYSGYLNADTVKIPEKVIRVAEKVKARRGFWIKQFESKEEILEIAPQIRNVYNQAFRSGEGFSPITNEEMVVIAKRLLSTADPRMIKLVYKKDEIVGFLFAYHNIGAGLRKAKGKLWPFGWFHIMREFKKTKSADANGIGILPEYQGMGATAILYIEMEKIIREFGFEHIDVVQVREDNTASLGEARILNVNWYKTHRVYQKKL